MNFQSVEQAGGEQVSMSGTFIEIGGTQFTINQKAKAICKIRDTVGASHNVHIYKGKGELPTQLNLGLLYQFNLSTFQGQYKNKPYTGYSGFWNDPAQVGQNTPQDSPQASQNAPQSTKPLDVGGNDVEIRKSVVCAFIASRHKPEIKEVEKWMKYIQSGTDPDASQYRANPNYVGDGQEGICPHCQKPLEDCICDIKF